MKSIIVFLAGVLLIMANPIEGADWIGKVLLCLGLLAMAVGWGYKKGTKA